MFTVRWLKQPQRQLKIVSKQQSISVSLDKIKPFPKRKQLKTIHVKVIMVTKWSLSLKKETQCNKMAIEPQKNCISSTVSVYFWAVSWKSLARLWILLLLKKVCFLKHLFVLMYCMLLSMCVKQNLNVILILRVEVSSIVWGTLKWCNVTGLMCKVHTGQTQNNLSLIITVLCSTPTRQLDAIRIMERKTYLFCCRGSPTLEDEYLSAVSSDPLRGGKQIPAIYLIPPEIMSQQAWGTQSFIGAHRLHGKINK